MMDMYKPVDQLRPNSFFNVFLISHIEGIWVPFCFIFQHVIMDISTEFRHLINVINCRFISSFDVIEDLVLASLFKHLKLLVDRDSRQFVSRRCSEARNLGLVSVFKESRWIFPLRIFFIFYCNSRDRSYTVPKVWWRMNSLSCGSWIGESLYSFANSWVSIYFRSSQWLSCLSSNSRFEIFFAYLSWSWFNNRSMSIINIF